MPSKIENYRKELNGLCAEGFYLKCGLRNEMDISYSKKELSGLDDAVVSKIKNASFRDNYQKWYNASLAVVKQLLPDRVRDYVPCYHSDSKKEKSLTNYGIEDYLLGLTLTAFSLEHNYSFIRKRFELQYEIVRSLPARLDSSIFEIRQLLEAEMFDSEIDAAAMLAKKGFLRGAGAICGVILEKHLKTVAAAHSLKLTKKEPTINDLNELLKNNGVIDISQWRHLQYLGDIRNLCDHDKSSEPTKENLNDLIAGAKKVLKTVY